MSGNSPQPQQPPSPPADVMQKAETRSILMALVAKNHALIASEMGAERLKTITADTIRQLIRNSGLFFENKLGTNQSLAEDKKFQAATQNNQTQWDGITRMQIATIFMQDQFFSFFDMDELEDEGIIKIRRDESGISLYLKLNFTKLGDTVIAIVPQTTGGGYNVTVRTAEDISDKLATVRIDKAAIRWGVLRKSDMKEFDMKERVLENLGGFSVIA